METKKCTKCKTEKSLSKFREKKGKPYSQCRQCENEYSKEHANKNRPDVRNAQNKWRKKRKAKVNAGQRAYYKDVSIHNPEYKEKAAEYAKKYRTENKKKRNDYNRKWREKNRENIRDMQKQERHILITAYVKRVAKQQGYTLDMIDADPHILDMIRSEIKLKRKIKEK